MDEDAQGAAQQPIQLSNEQFQQLLGRLTTVGQGNQQQQRPTVKFSERPTVEIEVTEGEWTVFLDTWARYKRMAKLENDAVGIRDNLRQCCSQQLNKRLFDLKGSNALDADVATEVNLLAWMKEIAVKGLHAEVHRTRFVNLKQKQGESVIAFAARLKAEALLCEFRVDAPDQCSDNNCNCENHGVAVMYEDGLMSTQIVAGLYNKEHQAKVLAES